MSDRRSDNGYLELDGVSNAIDYLGMAELALHGDAGPYKWKWATIGLTSGLYGLMIVVLSGTNNDRVIDDTRLPKKDRRELERLAESSAPESHVRQMELHDEFRRRGSANLISFKDALERIQDSQWMLQFTESKIVELTSKQVDNILELRWMFRNPFEHFVPTTWAIQELCFVPLFRDTLEAIRQLGVSFNLWFQDQDARPSLERIVARLMSLLDENEKRLLSTERE